MDTQTIRRRRMTNTRLIGRGFASAAEAVGWHLAFQSQEYGLAKWALGQRVPGARDEDVEAEFAAGTFLRIHVMRPTWHFVLPDDIVWLLELTGPRIISGNRSRYAQLGLDPSVVRRTRKAIEKALSAQGPLTRKEIGAILTKASINVDGQRLPHILMDAELELVVTSGPPRGKEQTYALLSERAPRARTMERSAAVRELVSRYLRSHGPATDRDLAWWSGLAVGDIRRAADELGDELRSETFHEHTYLWSREARRLTRSASPVAHLLQPFDEYTVAYTASRHVAYPPGKRPILDASAMIDGEFVGFWRRRIRGDPSR